MQLPGSDYIKHNTFQTFEKTSAAVQRHNDILHRNRSSNFIS